MADPVRYAVPTHRRPRLLREATLAMLERWSVPPASVDLFATAEYLPDYAAALAPEWAARLIPAPAGLANNRRAAELSHYPEGARVFWLDDDVRALCRRVDARRCEEVSPASVAEQGFTAARAAGAWLWGVYAVLNPYYMRERLSVGLYFCVGCAYGVTVRHDPSLQPDCGDAKEDYERCLRYHARDGVLARLDYYAPRTGYAQGSGGIQRTPASVEDNVRLIESRWPGLTRRNRRKKSAYAEIDLLRARPAGVPA